MTDEAQRRRRDTSLARASAALGMKRYTEALAAASDAVAADPGSAECHGQLAEALAGADQYEAALREIDVALSQGADDDGWLEWFHRLRAIVLDNLARHDEALIELDRALELNPESHNAHYLRARMLDALDRLEEARAASQEAVSLEPETPMYLRQLGDLWVDADPVAAEGHYRAALAIDPNDSTVLTNLSKALLHQHRNAEAAAVAGAALRLAPNRHAAQTNTRLAVGRMLWRFPLIGASITFIAPVVLAIVGVGWLVRRHPVLLAIDVIVGGSLFGFVTVALTQAWRRRRDELRGLDPALFAAYRRLTMDRKGEQSAPRQGRRG